MDRLLTQGVEASLCRFRFLEFIHFTQGTIVAQFYEYKENASCDNNVTSIQWIWVFVCAFQVSSVHLEKSVFNITVTRFKSPLSTHNEKLISFSITLTFLYSIRSKVI